ncbi:MAG TPA: DegT/DnrJ/EryC1/StrS family aminotransferase [Chthoniobacteraceae bacterium]|nr:DegT/DnrJ/EryC1/StrS family aminotransferase [Chthoniobacteraceae bacterium]
MNQPPLIVTHPQDALLQWPHFTPEDEAALLRILRDGNVSTHPVIGELERAFAEATGRKHALAHCNGTAGLLAAFHALGLAPGDEVLVPTATFWASVLPMIWCGLVPVFCESEPETLGLDPDDAERRITPRTKAMVIVHLWGLPCKVEKLLAVAHRHGLKVIEDASHAHGASADGVPCGRFGDISVFSLQGDKLVPAGEGGVLLTDDETYLERALCLGDITRILRLPSAARRFAATSFGVKTRIAPLSAALGLQMLRRLPETNAIRRENHDLLAQTLEPLGFNTFPAPPGQERVYFEWLIRPRDESLDLARLLPLLTAMGCRVGLPRYPLLHQQPFFTEGYLAAVGRYPAGTTLPDYASLDLPCTARTNGQMIRLPNFSHRGAQPLIAQYAQAFREAMALMA